jgi:protein disulfide-isomerase A1
MSRGEEEVEILQDNEVYVLDDSNFEDVISAFEYVFVEFYAPWC